MRTFPAALVYLGEQKITCTSTAKRALNSTVGAANLIRFSVETNSVRAAYYSNSTVPSRATGVLYVAGGPYEIELNTGYNLKFNSLNTTAGVINIVGFKYAGAS